MKVVLFDLIPDGHHSAYVYFVARGLVTHGDEVILVTSRRTPVWEATLSLGKSVRAYYVGEENNSIAGHVVRTRVFDLWRQFNCCLDLARKEKADAVLHLYLDRSILPLYASVRGKSLPFKVFGLLLWPYFVNFEDEKKNVFKKSYHGLEKWALAKMMTERRVHGLFVLTEHIKDLLTGTWGNGVRDRITVVPDPVEAFDPIPQDIARDQLGIERDKPMFVFLGRLTRDKGADVFLEALPFVKGEWVAVLAGLPFHVGEAQVEAARVKLKSRGRLITDFNFISDDDMKRYLCAADAIVLPYRKSYMGPSGILQLAAAAGKPVIASDVHEVGRIVRQEGIGVLCEPESPLALSESLNLVVGTRVEMSEAIKPRALRYAQASDSRIMAQRIREAMANSLR